MKLELTPFQSHVPTQLWTQQTNQLLSLRKHPTVACLVVKHLTLRAILNTSWISHALVTRIATFIRVNHFVMATLIAYTFSQTIKGHVIFTMIVHELALLHTQVSTDKNSLKATQQILQILALPFLQIFTVVWMRHQGRLVMVKVAFRPFAGKTEVVLPINAKTFVRGNLNAIFTFKMSEGYVFSIILVNELERALTKESPEYARRKICPHIVSSSRFINSSWHDFSFLLFQLV